MTLPSCCLRSGGHFVQTGGPTAEWGSLSGSASPLVVCRGEGGREGLMGDGGGLKDGRRETPSF